MLDAQAFCYFLMSVGVMKPLLTIHASMIVKRAYDALFATFASIASTRPCTRVSYCASLKFLGSA